MKIATLLAVGQAIDQSKDWQKDSRLNDTYLASYQTIFNSNTKAPLGAKIANVYTALNNYLKDANQYKCLQDYISYPRQN